MTLPHLYVWLDTIGTRPRMVEEGLKLLGTLETPGTGNNPVIMAWRDELRAAGKAVDGYTADSVPWCGLFVAICALRAGKDPVAGLLWALNWRVFGAAVPLPPTPAASLGDVLVFKRRTPTGWAGHVGIYIAEDAACFHVLGGNQGDAVSIARVEKDRCVAVRRPPYNNRPASAVPYHMTATGAVSKSEA